MNYPSIFAFLLMTFFYSQSLFAQLSPRLIVQLKERVDSGGASGARLGDVDIQTIQTRQMQRISQLASVQNESRVLEKRLSNNQLVIELSSDKTKQQLDDILSQLEKDQAVAYVEVDTVMTIAGIPNDSLFNSQWALRSAGGINALDAWQLSTGDHNVVIAVLDTGIIDHPDLAGRVLPGADLISDLFISNNGKGRHHDGRDPGDWIESYDPCSQGSFVPSSWHGTHVAGIIGASSNNGQGIAGVDWAARILPVRVLGKCGGYSSDIADGIRWAAGLPVDGLAINPHPADIINLSLGGSGPCSANMQHAIDQARAQGATVVVASGNSGLNLDIFQFSPANCNGVITVAAHNKQGVVTSYSNRGSVIDITAPGGDHINGVLSTLNQGSRSATGANYVRYYGTSMAAPHVSGVLGLIKAINPGLYPDQLHQIIKESAIKMSSFECPQQLCGPGRLDAYQALVLAQNEVPDPSYRTPMPSTPGGQERRQLLSTEGGSGGCGTIVDISQLPPGGGSAGAPALFFFFLSGLLIMRFAQEITQ